jgi:hypothetical protein
MQGETYYPPYQSDSGSDSDSESDSSLRTDSTSSSYAARVKPPALPNFRALAQGLTLSGLSGGLRIDSSGAELNSAALSLGFPMSKGYPTFKNYEIGKDPSGGELKTASQNVTSIVMLDSRDRDRLVFPQPTSLTLRLPRVYSNVTNFQLVQIKLLSSFFYFRNNKRNTDISILELNRTTVEAGKTIPNIVKNFIREGTYNINTLLSELTTQLNRTPVFYDYPNGFQDFAPRFAATGDFSLNFNFPGDTFYDSLLDQYISNPTMALIISKYFQNQYAGLSSYTTDQIKIAYYYPVVKEILLDNTYPTQLNLAITTSTAALLPGETVRSRCIYTFQGLNDPVVLEVINLNIPTLEEYRTKHTFRYTLINKYNVTYETNNNRVTISAPSLNTSLVNLITYKQRQFFLEELNRQGITEAQYNSFQQQNTILLAVLNDLFYFIQKELAVYFGIPFNTYSLEYIASPSLVVPIRDAQQATGISSNYDLAVLERNTAPISNDILSPFKVSAKPYWNRLTDLSESTFAYPFNLETGVSSTTSNYPYSVLLKQQDELHKFVDSNDYLYANQLTRFADVVVPIEATKYTVFRFKSPVRQTLQVETLPRPTEYRYPAYNAIHYDLSAQKVFDNSYCFIQSSINAKMDVSPTFATNQLTRIPGFSTFNTTSNFGVSYPSSLALWGSNVGIAQVGDTINYYTFYTPKPPGAPVAPGYRYPINLTIANLYPTSNFPTPMNLYLYNDRGAFMADVSSNRAETPINYLTAVSTLTDVSSATLTFQVYAGNQYYAIARSRDLAIPTTHYRVVPWFPSSTAYTALTSTLSNFDPFADPSTPAALSNTNYATLADPAFIKLPIQSTIQSQPTQDQVFSTLTFSTVAIGYDASGVSTDLTDYCGFTSGAPSNTGAPTTSLRTDPITGYSFQVDRGYDTATQTYLNPVSGNAILSPQGAGVYTPGTVAARETSIAQWYGTTYIPNSENQTPMLSNQIAPASNIAPFTSNTTNAALSGYTYGGSNGAIQFGDGIYGISFIPQQGLWDLQRFMFKSVYTTSNAATDENLNIQYLGIYNAAITTNRFVHEISLDDAICVLRFSKAVTYTSNSLNLGFDPTGGTYYEFVRDSNYPMDSNAYLNGYTQIRQTMNPDINAIYTAIPFNGNKQFQTFQGLVGSPVPYPYFSDASSSLAYYDGSRPQNGFGIVVPKQKVSPDSTRGPPTGYDQTQSKYEQSMTVGTNLMLYINPYPFALLSNTMTAFDPLPYAPSLVVADVSGYIMTQDSFYRVFQYSADTDNYTLVEKYQFTLDQVYPEANPQINFIGVAANESRYAFFAYSNTLPASPTTSKLLIRTVVPATGLVESTAEYSNLPGFDPTTQQVTNFSYNNFGGFTLALKAGSVVTALCKHNSNTDAMTLVTNTDPAGFNSNVDRFILRQSPKEQNGSFYVFPYRSPISGAPVAQGIIDYVLVTPSNLVAINNPLYKYAASTGPQATWPTGTSPCQIQVFNLSNVTSPVTPVVYREPILSRQPFKDYLYFLSEQTPTYFYQVVNFSPSNATQFTSNALTIQSRYQFPTATSNFTQGANGSKWSLIGNILYGNRNDTVDSPRKIYQAWQLFYPVQRIVFRQIAKNFTYMHNISGLTYPEYPHTALIGYDSSGAITADTNRRWGLESSSNFLVADFSFSGRTFNSYLFTMPLQKSSVSKPYYYLAVRGYSPTEKSQVLVRFSLNNRYDFGYVSMSDISNEVLLKATVSNQFTPDYYAAITAFNSNFIIDSNGRIFGANVVQGYAGSNFSNVISFGDFYGRFVSLYNQYNTQVQLIQEINSNVSNAVRDFITYDLQNILPATSLNRQRFTDPLTYTILWRSALYPEYLKLEENWGLGWNLGFAKQDTPYETVHRADSFFKILDDFINLRLNPEFDMNRMDTSAKENLSRTMEPTGSTKAFHAKLLLANFGSFAQTLISNPVAFSPPLGRLDKLSFQWVDITGAVIDNADCEWNAVIQLVEKRDVAEIPKPLFLNPTVGR